MKMESERSVVEAQARQPMEAQARMFSEAQVKMRVMIQQLEAKLALARNAMRKALAEAHSIATNVDTRYGAGMEMAEHFAPIHCNVLKMAEALEDATEDLWPSAEEEEEKKNETGND